jgi:hypothetical protein
VSTDDVVLRELEVEVREELTLVEASEPVAQAINEPTDTWLSDPADAQRYEVGLHSLLGAVESVEEHDA